MRYYYRYYSPAAPWLIGFGYVFLIGIIVYLFVCLHKADKVNLELKQKIIHYEGCRDIRDAVEKVHKWEDDWRQLHMYDEIDYPR